MKRIERVFLTGVVMLLVGCASSSSSGIALSVSRGEATSSYAGTYVGTVSLTSTADVVAVGSATDNVLRQFRLRSPLMGWHF